ncbi:hypothetical protein ABZ760_37140, partial [Streptomyces sp. NPDC006658]|uniref:hypothetical protein n=1 Tax=Streptomyces sp. NPDC006658 TaxID=3156900 RepID=UPI0033EF18D6
MASVLGRTASGTGTQGADVLWVSRGAWSSPSPSEEANHAPTPTAAATTTPATPRVTRRRRTAALWRAPPGLGPP